MPDVKSITDYHVLSSVGGVSLSLLKIIAMMFLLKKAILVGGANKGKGFSPVSFYDDTCTP